jgi:hypothetical protein
MYSFDFTNEFYKSIFIIIFLFWNKKKLEEYIFGIMHVFENYGNGTQGL